MDGAPAFTVVALLKHTKSSRATVSAVKLARDWYDAACELQRMINVTTETLGAPGLFGGYTIDRGHGWAHVEFGNGPSYHFSIQEARWAGQVEVA